MPRRDFKTPFAVSGDQTQIPTDIQPDGSVSIIQGYGPDYQRPTDGTDPQAKVIERAKFNSLMNDVTASLGEIQQNGFPIWSAGMAPYPAGAWVYHNSSVWRNTIANNTNDPASPNSGWVGAVARGTQRFTTSGEFSVPPGVSTIYVTAVAGGGSGGSGGGSSGSGRVGVGGGGGGAGQSVIKQAISVNAGTSISITIGQGGASVAGGATNGATGNAGGNTIIGSLSLNGGGGGARGTNSPSGSGGGVPGGTGYPAGGGSMDTTPGSASGVGGGGASSSMGGGGFGGRGTLSNGIAGVSAGGYGAGGGGGGGCYTSGGNGVGGSSGAGSPGIVIIEW